MKIVVTGGAGFIGSRLVEKLTRNGHTTRVIDITTPEHNGGFSFNKTDITDLEATKNAIAGNEVVYHLAGAVLDGVRRSPYAGTELNVSGTLNVLEGCRINDVKKIIFASTFYVYDGIDPTVIVDENTPLNSNGMELFGASKLIGENLVRTYCQKYGLRFVIMRFGSAYGSGNCSNIVKVFLESGMNGKPAAVWGRGHRWNQYTFVDDIAEGSVLSLQGENEIFNLISPEQTTIKELATLAKELTNLETEFDLSKKDGTSMPYMSSERARIKLKWKPITLREGIQRTIDEMRGHSVPAMASTR
jgi:UDP-glucose 4-epimerase